MIFIILTPPLSPDHAFCQSARISMDGHFSDWEQLMPVYANRSHSFFEQLRIANDERFLFLMIEVGREINLQNDNRLVVYLDTDNNRTTGKPVHDIGAELEWQFGEKTGAFYIEKCSYPLRHIDIGLVTMPTITSTRFEITIDRAARMANHQLLFNHNSIGIAFEKEATHDFMPAAGESINYTFDNSPLPPLPKISLNKQNKNQLRVMTYNVLRDNLFKIEKRQYFNRILKAVQPDIIGFEEIHNHSAKQTAKLIESILPSPKGQKWFCSKVEPDIIAVSRFNIKNSYPIKGNGAFLINLHPKYSTNLLLIVAHPPSGSRNQQRQQEIDAIMAFIRDAKKQMKTDTPILIIGDMNLVGYSEQLQTLLSGEILNQNLYGPSFKPDWDGTDFTALLPCQTDLLMAYTWFDKNNSFSPGRLDYIIYSDSVIEPGNHFVLFTPEMSADSLAHYGLKSQDVVQASDHLPVVGDFIFPLFSDFKN